MSDGPARDSSSPIPPAVTQAANQPLCDICARGLRPGERHVVSPSEMRVIARNGFGRHVSLWGNLPLNERESKFYQLAIADDTDWALCPACYQHTRDFAVDLSRGFPPDDFRGQANWNQFDGATGVAPAPGRKTIPAAAPVPFKPYDAFNDPSRGVDPKPKSRRAWLVVLAIAAVLAISAVIAVLVMKHRFDQQSARRQEAQAAFDQGLSYAKSGKPVEAAAMFEKAIKLRTDFVEAYAQLALAYQKLNRTQEAIDTAQRAISFRPNEAWLHRNLGEVYRAAGRWSESIEAYKRAVALQADYPAAYNEMGFSYRKLKQPREAIEAYKHALQTNADYPQAHYGLGLAYLDIDDHSSASKEAETLKTLNRPDLAKELKKYIQTGEHGVTTEEAAAPP